MGPLRHNMGLSCLVRILPGLEWALIIPIMGFFRPGMGPLSLDINDMGPLRPGMVSTRPGMGPLIPSMGPLRPVMSPLMPDMDHSSLA